MNAKKAAEEGGGGGGDSGRRGREGRAMEEAAGTSAEGTGRRDRAQAHQGFLESWRCEEVERRRRRRRRVESKHSFPMTRDQRREWAALADSRDAADSRFAGNDRTNERSRRGRRRASRRVVVRDDIALSLRLQRSRHIHRTISTCMLRYINPECVSLSTASHVSPLSVVVATGLSIRSEVRLWNSFSGIAPGRV